MIDSLDPKMMTIPGTRPETRNGCPFCAFCAAMGKRALCARASAESAATDGTEVTEVKSSTSNSSLSTDSSSDDNDQEEPERADDDAAKVESTDPTVPTETDDGKCEQLAEPEPMVEPKPKRSKNGKKKKAAAAASASEKASDEIPTAGANEDASSASATGREIHHRIRQQAVAEQWPEGAPDLASAFQWPSYNAKKLLASDDSFGSPDADTALHRLKKTMQLLEYNFEIHESHGGTGNGATTLHHQAEALVQECRTQAHRRALAAGLARLTHIGHQLVLSCCV